MPKDKKLAVKTDRIYQFQLTVSTHYDFLLLPVYFHQYVLAPSNTAASINFKLVQEKNSTEKTCVSVCSVHKRHGAQGCADGRYPRW